MAAQINFPTIPPNILIPLFYADFDNSQAGVNQDNQVAILIGQTITASPEVPTFAPDGDWAAATFGARSMLAAMVAAYRVVDPFGTLYVLPLADAGGSVAATGSLSFTGSPTVASTLALYIAGTAIPVALAAGLTAAQVATAVQAAIAASLSLPVTATIDGVHNYQVDLVAANKGIAGNSIDVRLNYYGVKNGEVTPAGLTVAITAMSGGTTDPDCSGLDAILGSTEYDFVALGGYSVAGSLNNIQTLMAGRWSWTRQDYGHVWTARMDADATGAGNLSFGQSRNDPHVTCVGYEPSPTPPWVVAPAYMAAFAISSKADPARPTQTLAVAGVLAPPASGRYSKSTKQTLLGAGIALMSYNVDGTAAILRSVTTYQQNAFGQPDQSYLDAETLFTLMAITRFLKNRITQKYPRAKLAQDGTNFGFTGNALSSTADIVTPNVVRAELIAAYGELEDQGLVQDTTDFAANLVVQVNAETPTRLDVLFPPYLINGLRIFALLNQFRLQTPAA